MGSAASAQTTWLVDPKATGNNSGLFAWVDAFTDLPTALLAAGPNDSILIAEDKYIPTTTSSVPRQATFTVRPGQTLIGGYLGVDGGVNASTNPMAPDGMARGTILSGELENAANNAFTVVTVTGAAGSFQVIRNLTIQDGYAEQPGGVDFEMRGGGLYADGPSVELIDVVFKDNYAEFEGGALWFEGLSGGAGTSGGIGLTNCTFWRNTSGNRGGAAFIAYPRGAANDDHDDSWVFNCTFIDNTAGSNAISLGTAGGAAIWFGQRLDGTIHLSNNQILGNTCRGIGSGYGGQGNVSTSTVNMINETFYGNHITETPFGAAGNVIELPTGGSGTPTIRVRNTIIWGNTWKKNSQDTTYVSSVQLGILTVEYSDIEMPPQTPSVPIAGLGNILANPMFANPAAFNVRLLAGSPCIDVGDDLALPLDYGDADGNGVRSGETLPVDWTGTQQRVIDSGAAGSGNCPAGCGLVDMGAFESN